MDVFRVPNVMTKPFTSLASWKAEQSTRSKLSARAKPKQMHLKRWCRRVFQRALPHALKQADLGKQRPGALADDYFHVVLGYGEMRVILHGSCLVSAVMPRFVVHGSQGSFIKFGMDVQEEQLKEGKRPPAADWGVDPAPGQLSQAQENASRISPATIAKPPTVPKSVGRASDA